MSQGARGEEGTPARRLSADERRSQLVDVALHVFAERGYTATTMDDVAMAAGVTKPLLYQHFDSKRALYLELVDAVALDMVEAISRVAATAEGPRQQVEAGIAAYFHLVASRQAAFRLLLGSDATGDPELSGALRRVEETVVELVDTLIDAGLEPEHRRLLAYGVMGMAEQASRYWLENPSTGPAGAKEGDRTAMEAEAARMARRIADLAWAGLRAVHRD
ncbi:MAG: TetR/AcrR family transcriptional regulator [Acidimicrobiales bacterium]|nr:TetR/AcrR family transcriptional regulator [Actinomycetota bacterium]MDA8183453.1 TetR/AcrR family transcriptional regulator [Actinomycetota bacterium]